MIPGAVATQNPTKGEMEAVELSRRDLAAQLDKISEQNAVRWTRQERAAYHDKSTVAVIEAYVRIRQLEPVVSSNPDPDPNTRREKLTYGLIDWIADIEMATEQALKDRIDLQSAWFSMALDESVDLRLRSEVVSRCGRVYVGRGLEPWKYWRRKSRRAA